MEKKSSRCSWLFALLIAAVALSAPGCTPKKKMTDGKPFPEIAILYNTSESHKKVAEVIKQMWQDELGIKTQLTNAEWKVYLKTTQSLDYFVSRAGWIGDYDDPNTFLDMWITKGGNNQTGWSDSEYDRLIDAAMKEADEQKRFGILSQAEDILINKGMPIIPIYFYVNQNLVKDYVKGMAYNLRDLHPIKGVYIEKDGKILPPAQQIFKFNNGTEIETLDPALMTGNAEFNIAMQVFEGLVVNDPKTLDPKPGIAHSWDVSPDKKTYTFHLRKNAKWSDGTPVTAGDFLYSWKRAMMPETAAEYAGQFVYVKNAAAFISGKDKDFSKVGIKVIDDYTIVTELENPVAFWLDLVAFHTFLPVNRKCVEKYDVKWTRPENIVTNGPFLLSEWKPKDRMVMVKNPAYYDAANVKLSKAIAFALDDNITGVQMFEAGQTDWVRTIPVTLVDKFKGKSVAHIDPFLSTYYYRLNVTKPPLDDVRVRKALNLAINKKAICEFVTRNGQTPATTFVPPGIKGYTPPKGPGYDPDEARKLLREAGYAVKDK